MYSRGNKEMEGRQARRAPPPHTTKDPYFIYLEFQNHSENKLTAFRKKSKKFKNTKQSNQLYK